jgi:hypothetical protein
VRKGLLPTDAVFFVNLKATLDEILRLFGNLSREHYFFVVNAIDELNLILGGPRGASMEHLIVDEANGPQI